MSTCRTSRLHHVSDHFLTTGAGLLYLKPQTLYHSLARIEMSSFCPIYFRIYLWVDCLYVCNLICSFLLLICLVLICPLNQFEKKPEGKGGSFFTGPALPLEHSYKDLPTPKQQKHPLYTAVTKRFRSEKFC